VSYFPVNVDEVQAIVREARSRGDALSPVGGGVMRHVGARSPIPTADLSLGKLTHVIEYSPADLVVVAQAGLTVAALQAILAEHGQWLPLEVARPDAQTLGGVVSSRANSLSRAANGSVRDWLIGCQVVGGDGQLIKGGGKVVKNVSGYDLPKLYCGSWGTLGAIVEVAFKVAPRPEASRTLLAVLGGNRNGEEALDALLAGMTPSFTYLLNAEAARAILGDADDGAQYLALRFDGLTEAVDASVAIAKDRLAPFCVSVLDLPDKIAKPLGDAVRDFHVGDSSLMVRYNVLSSQVGAFARMLEWTASKGGFRAKVVAECLTGVMYAAFEPLDAEAAGWTEFYPAFRDKSDRVGGTHVLERMPEEWREAGAAVWSPVLPDVEIMRGIKRALDPGNVFNPGRFIGGV
jgi:glycolate oxidase FAD binding subunit